MVYLALTPQGAHDVMNLARDSGSAVWVGSDGLSDAEYEEAGRSGVKISRFIYALVGADRHTVDGAIETVVEHHPNETIWVEQRVRS